jgi:hypothetical protein
VVEVVAPHALTSRQALDAALAAVSLSAPSAKKVTNLMKHLQDLMMLPTTTLNTYQTRKKIFLAIRGRLAHSRATRSKRRSRASCARIRSTFYCVPMRGIQLKIIGALGTAARSRWKEVVQSV